MTLQINPSWASCSRLVFLLTFVWRISAAFAADPVNPQTLDGKVMCGYQGWFRCPGDASNLGWIHWSRDSRKIAPDTLSFEMWPDTREFPPSDRYPAPGFQNPDGTPAYLYSSESPTVVQKHFEWMRDAEIDGVWLQHFLVDLPGGPQPNRYATRMRVLDHVRNAALKTGRVWALSYDIAGMETTNIFDVLTRDWQHLVDSGITSDPRYLHENGKPVVQAWGFYYGNQYNKMTAELGLKLVNFFKTPGKYSAFFVGGGDWDWRAKQDSEWQKLYKQFDAYVPWNIGNYTFNSAGEKCASTHYWNDDMRACAAAHVKWIPSIYPGFSWDNLQQKPAGQTIIPRRGGKFLWEQFHALAERKITTVYVAMFDEVDEGTAIFKVTSSPPPQAHFVGYEGKPGDWYLHLTHEGIRMLRGARPVSAEIPVLPVHSD